MILLHFSKFFMHIFSLVLLFFFLVLNILVLPLVFYLIFLNTDFLVFLNLLNYKILNNYKIFHYHFYDFFLLFHYVVVFLAVSYDVLYLTPLIMLLMDVFSLYLLYYMWILFHYLSVFPLVCILNIVLPLIQNLISAIIIFYRKLSYYDNLPRI